MLDRARCPAPVALITGAVTLMSGVNRRLLPALLWLISRSVVSAISCSDNEALVRVGVFKAVNASAGETEDSLWQVSEKSRFVCEPESSSPGVSRCPGQCRYNTGSPSSEECFNVAKQVGAVGLNYAQLYDHKKGHCFLHFDSTVTQCPSVSGVEWYQSYGLGRSAWISGAEKEDGTDYDCHWRETTPQDTCQCAKGHERFGTECRPCDAEHYKQNVGKDAWGREDCLKCPLNAKSSPNRTSCACTLEKHTIINSGEWKEEKGACAFRGQNYDDDGKDSRQMGVCYGKYSREDCFAKAKDFGAAAAKGRRGENKCWIYLPPHILDCPSGDFESKWLGEVGYVERAYVNMISKDPPSPIDEACIWREPACEVLVCPAGSMTDNDQGTCVTCEAGTFSSEPGQEGCRTCPTLSTSLAGAAECSYFSVLLNILAGCAAVLLLQCCCVRCAGQQDEAADPEAAQLEQTQQGAPQPLGSHEHDLQLLRADRQAARQKAAPLKRIDSAFLGQLERSDSGTAISPNATCAICLEDFNKNDIAQELPCKHMFHKECLAGWLATRHRTCPTCRNLITGEI